MPVVRPEPGSAMSERFFNGPIPKPRQRGGKDEQRAGVRSPGTVGQRPAVRAHPADQLDPGPGGGVAAGAREPVEGVGDLAFGGVAGEQKLLYWQKEDE